MESNGLSLLEILINPEFISDPNHPHTFDNLTRLIQAFRDRKTMIGNDTAHTLENWRNYMLLHMETEWWVPHDEFYVGEDIVSSDWEIPSGI